MNNLDDMPDWLKSEKNEEELKRQRLEEIHSEINRITPTDEQITGLIEAARSLNEQIERLKPDVILFTGRSSQLSEALFKATSANNRPILRMSSKITPYFYGLADDDSLLEESRTQLQQECPNLQADQSVMIVDDYAGSGSKSDKFITSMRKLGFHKTHFGVFVSQENRDSYNPNLLIGAQNDCLTSYVMHLAMMISLTKRSETEVGDYAPFIPEIRQKSKAVLATLLSSANRN